MPRKTSKGTKTGRIFGERLRQLREAEGWSLDELGRQVQASGPAIYRWENNLSWPSAGDFEVLAVVFGIEPWELLQPPGATPRARERGTDPKVREAVETIVTALGITLKA
jgi:transcriptional regulator with XRE-family HTH domain